MNRYRIDITDDRTGRELVREIGFQCDSWDLPEAILVTKVMVSNREMGKRENKDKLSFRLPARDYRATVKEVVEVTRTLSTKA